MKRKILFFIQNGVGGAERMTVNIAKLLPLSEYDITFCKISIPCALQNGRIDDFIPKNLKITNISWSSQIALIKQMWGIMKRIKPDVVFSSLMPYNQRLLLLKPFFKSTRFIVRNDNYLFTISPIKRFTLKYTYRNASTIIAQTEEMKSELCELGLNADKIVVLHNFLDTELISSKANAPSPFPIDSITRYVAVGRFAPQKGFDILVKAFAEVIKEKPDSELYIVGDHETNGKIVYNELLALIKDLNINDKVFFVGYTDNPYRYIKNASVYVLSSRYEGLPNVLVEAQFLKTPSAAVECIPIISRMIHDGFNGYLAEPENPQSLAQAMISSSKIEVVIPIYKSSSKEDFISVFKE